MDIQQQHILDYSGPCPIPFAEYKGKYPRPDLKYDVYGRPIIETQCESLAYRDCILLDEPSYRYFINIFGFEPKWAFHHHNNTCYGWSCDECFQYRFQYRNFVNQYVNRDKITAEYSVIPITLVPNDQCCYVWCSREIGSLCTCFKDHIFNSGYYINQPRLK